MERVLLEQDQLAGAWALAAEDWLQDGGGVFEEVAGMAGEVCPQLLHQMRKKDYWNSRRAGSNLNWRGLKKGCRVCRITKQKNNMKPNGS